MKYYYLLISDAVYAAKNGSYKHDWEFKLAYFLFVMIFLNINTFMILFDLDYNLFKVNLSNSRRFNERLNALLHTAPVIISFLYFTIFRNNNYEKIQTKYPHSNKKLFIIYAAFSIIVGFGSWFLLKWTKGILIFWDQGQLSEVFDDPKYIGLL